MYSNTGDQTLNYFTTNYDKTNKSNSQSLNLNNLKSVSALHKKTISFDEYSSNPQQKKQVWKNNMNLVGISSRLIPTSNDQPKQPLSTRSCAAPIKK